MNIDQSCYFAVPLPTNEIIHGYCDQLFQHTIGKHQEEQDLKKLHKQGKKFCKTTALR